jgi:hypothetical protein
MFMIEMTAVFIGFLPLIFGFVEFHNPVYAIISLVIGVIWVTSYWLQRSWLTLSIFLLLVILAGIGAWKGLSPLLTAVCVTADIVVLDLAGFRKRLKKANSDNLHPLIKKHIVRLSWYSSGSLILIFMASYMRLKIPFIWIFILALLAVLGMTQLVNRFNGRE